MAYNILISDLEIDTKFMVQCKKNHNLEKMDKGKMGTSWKCDDCSQSVGGTTNKHRFTCRACDFDNCDKCVANRITYESAIVLVKAYQPTIDE